jgi:metallo-beta-lactamase family protein
MPVKLSFFGAAGEVTGSCYLLETGRARILIDFGLHQGSARAELCNRRVPPIAADRLDAAILTHAHIDHCGRLPMLPRLGFRSCIFATPATIELAEIMLRDSANVQRMDAERYGRAHTRQGKRPTSPMPLYTPGEVEALLPRFSPLPYDSPLEVAPGIVARLVDAGHIIGSASVELTVEEDGRRKVIVFSGDVGPAGAPLMRDPTHFASADVAILESTYGDRDHRSLNASLAELAAILASARAGDGKVLIPAFAVGRTQMLIHHFSDFSADGRLAGAPVIIDSPMAQRATDLYRRWESLFDQESSDQASRGRPPLRFPELRFTQTPLESASLNPAGGGMIVIAASGMCTGGRILHHLRHNVWKPQTHLVIVGYQAQGSTGRRLVDGARKINLMGEPVAVRAQVHTLGGFSAHAGQSGLLDWVSAMAASRPRLFLTHGEDRPRGILRERIKTRTGLRAECPRRGESFNL